MFCSSRQLVNTLMKGTVLGVHNGKKENMRCPTGSQQDHIFCLFRCCLVNVPTTDLDHFSHINIVIPTRRPTPLQPFRHYPRVSFRWRDTHWWKQRINLLFRQNSRRCWVLTSALPSAPQTPAASSASTTLSVHAGTHAHKQTRPRVLVKNTSSRTEGSKFTLPCAYAPLFFDPIVFYPAVTQTRARTATPSTVCLRAADTRSSVCLPVFFLGGTSPCHRLNLWWRSVWMCRRASSVLTSWPPHPPSHPPSLTSRVSGLKVGQSPPLLLNGLPQYKQELAFRRKQCFFFF